MFNYSTCALNIAKCSSKPDVNSFSFSHIINAWLPEAENNEENVGMADVLAKMSKFYRIDHKKVARDDGHVYNVELIERTL
jgi:hypothetical protein